MNEILLVEDDAELATMTADFLRGESFSVQTVGDGAIAITQIREGSFDAVILDIGLPNVDGVSVCREVRSDFNGPIIMLTARGDEIDEVVSLEVGADDYLTKPVRPRALLARLRMHLRRIEHTPPPAGEESGRLSINGVTIDPSSRNVTVDGNVVELTTAEFDLLLYLSQRAGKIVDRHDIYQDLLELPYDGMDRSIDLRVSRLRKKIGDDPNSPSRIKSVRGVGYLMATDS